MNDGTASAKHFALVIGASGGIGAALVSQFLATESLAGVIAVSRSPAPQRSSVDDENEKLTFIGGVIDEAGIVDTVNRIAARLKSSNGRLSQVCIATGVLHGDGLFPEKKIEDIESSAIGQVLAVNAVLPLLWLKALTPLLSDTRSGGDEPCVVAVLSARVGSIGDNRLGGWYSYRASKAALNMLLKTAAVEFARRAKSVKLIAFHPGTTDTPLSAPFQDNVAVGKLFTPDFVAERLLNVMSTVEPDGQLSYVDWAGKPIDW